MPKQWKVIDITLKAIGKTGSIRNRLIVGAASTFGLRIASTGLTFISSVLFARLLGKSGFGIYTYATTWAALLCVPGTLGFDSLLVREIAIYQNQAAWGLMRGILRWTNQMASVFSVGFALLSAGLAWHFGQNANSNMLLAFYLAMVSLPIASLRNIRRGAMRGLNQVEIGLLPELLIAPLLLIVLTGGAYLLLEKDLTAHWLIGIYAVITGITFLISTGLLNRTLPNAVRKATPEYQVRVWISSALFFMGWESIYAISPLIDILLLGALKGADVVGLYWPVSRGAQLISFIPMATSSVLAPIIVSLYADGKTKQLQQLITRSARAILLISLPACAMLLGFGYWYLLLFGPEFTKGQNAFTILCIGQFVAIVTGLAEVLLSMTGHERAMTINSGVSALLSVILNILLIPQWGAEGAASATTISIILVNIANMIWVRKKLGIHSTALGTWGKII